MAASPPPGLKVRQRPPVSARSPQPELPPHLQKYVATGEALVAEPFKGITADGSVIPETLPDREDRRFHPAGHGRRPGAPGLAERRAAGAGALCTGHRRVAPLEQHPPLPHAARPAARGDERG